MRTFPLGVGSRLGECRHLGSEPGCLVRSRVPGPAAEVHFVRNYCVWPFSAPCAAAG